MATYAAIKPAVKPGYEETQEPFHKIRITLSSKNVKNLEKGLSNFYYKIVFLHVFLLHVMCICSFCVEEL